MILTIRAHDVAPLRALALEDFSQAAERMATCQHDEDREGFRDVVEQSARVLDALGWDRPHEGDRQLHIRPGFLRSWLCAISESAVATLETDREPPPKRRQALSRLACCVGVLDALEAVA